MCDDTKPDFFPAFRWDKGVTGGESSGAADDAADDEPMVTVLESLCMACHETGETRLLLTKIPYFREVVLMAFRCPHCNFNNSEVQTASEIQLQGRKYEVKVAAGDRVACDRQVIKAETAIVYIPELQFEVPAITQKGVCSTIEGIVCGAASALEAMQDERRKIDPETTAKLDAVIATLYQYGKAEQAFTFILDDPAGNSFVENKFAPKADPSVAETKYIRDATQNAAVGLTSDDMAAYVAQQEVSAIKEEPEEEAGNISDEVVELPVNCHVCNLPGTNKMKVCNIPHFKEIVLMSFNCEGCGCKSTEVKPGGAISAKGRKTTLTVTCVEDLSRDLLKSDTAGMSLPELEVEMAPGTLGGMFTTVEGILRQSIDHMTDGNPFLAGDSAEGGHRTKYEAVVARMRSLLEVEAPFTLVLDDPLANSYIQNVYAPDDDPNMTVEEYERSDDQNEWLGLNDMDV